MPPYKDPAKRRAAQRRSKRRARARAALKRQQDLRDAFSATLPPLEGCDVAEAVAVWAEQTLKIPTGPRRGQPFKLDAWQVDWMRGALAEGIREAGLSCARKNGKSGGIAVVILAYLAGPLNRPEWRGLVASLTGDLAKELRDAVKATAEISGLLWSVEHAAPVRVFKSPAPGRIEGMNGARVDFVNADKASGHAAGADLALLDDGGLLTERKRNLWDAFVSCISARDGRFWCISVQGTCPMFQELRARETDPAVFFQEFAAPDGADLQDESAWAAANPGLGTIKSLAYMRDRARAAAADPKAAPGFRSLDLNQPTQPRIEAVVELDAWKACEVKTPADLDEVAPRRGPVVLGLDIGQSSSMTAALGIWPATWRCEAWAALPDTPSLMERGKADGVGNRYQVMADRGELQTWPGTVTTPVREFLCFVDAQLDGEQVLACGADQYRRAEVTQALLDAGLAWPMQWRRQGAGPQGGESVRAFQLLVIEGLLRIVESWLVRSAIGEACIHRDANGNPGLRQLRKRSRIDAVSAGVLAAALGRRAASMMPLDGRPPAGPEAARQVRNRQPAGGAPATLGSVPLAQLGNVH